MPQARRPKIVIVEDEGLIAAELGSRLEKAGYSVPGTADSAQTALDVIEKTSPDLILMDIRLKGNEDGIEVANRVRQKLDIPVVYLTAYEDRETLERAGRTQAFGYIKKPIATASLTGAIEIALSKHRYETELRKARDWAMVSFASMPYAVLVTDGAGRVTYMNSLAEELAGWSGEKALNHPVTQVLRLRSRITGKPVEDQIQLAMVEGEKIPLPKDIYLIGSQERIYAVAGSVAPRWQDGRVEGAIIVLNDVTLDRFEEEQLREENKHEALHRMADGLTRHLPDLDEVAKESALLLESLPGGNPLRGSAEKINRAAMDAVAATGHLRAFLEPPKFDLEQIMLDNVAERFEEGFASIEPGFTLIVDPEPMPVQVDPWQLLRAMLNVGLHARSRKKPGTLVVMDLCCAEPEQMGQWARIRTTYATLEEDAATLERAFEPSWRGRSEDLHITHCIVKGMGGLARVQLEHGDLVRFDIFLPLAKAESSDTTAPKLEQSAVLLIEPNPEIRRTLHTHFAEHGLSLLEAGGGDEALVLAEFYRGPIPLVIANVGAAGDASAALVQRFADIDPSIRVRLLDGYVEANDPRPGLDRSQAIRNLTKWDLLAWVREALGHSKPDLCIS